MGDYQFNNHAFDGPSSSVNMDDHELKVSQKICNLIGHLINFLYVCQVKKFLDAPRDEDDYEEKVRKLVAEASKYQKERKKEEEKAKKRKKKEEKKLKKESKKKRKEEKKKKKGSKELDIREALK